MNRCFLPLLPVVALLLLPVLVQAQSPRMVLIEEATNASCGPCAAQNPTFEHYLAEAYYSDIIIPVVYHASWPGQDVIHAANPTMNDTRIAGYGISGVPTVITNGRVVPTLFPNSFYTGAPADTFTISSEVEKLRGTTSPISIDVSQSIEGSDLKASVTVSSTKALNGAHLQIIAVERHHYYTQAGLNGEKDFYYIARAMLPSVSGVLMSLDANDSTTVDESVALDPEWTPSEMYFVAFVQDDASHEVLQAGTSRNRVEFRTAEPTAQLDVTSEGGQAAWTGALNVDQAGSFTLGIDRTGLPSGWTGSVSIAGSEVQDGASVDATSTQALSVVIDRGTGAAGVGSIRVSLKGPRGGYQEQTYRLYAGNFQVGLIKRDEGDPSIATAYEAALTQSGLDYVIFDPLDDPMLDLSRLPVLVLESGKWTLSAQDMARAEAYVDGGGRLMVAGAEVAWSIGDPSSPDPKNPEFLHDYLHADYVADAGPGQAITGAPGDVISDGLDFSIGTGVQNQDTPDEIAPRDGAVPIFFYGSGTQHVAGLRWENSHTRLVYLGFGLEGIGDAGMRTNVLDRSIQWLMGTLGTDELDDAVAGMSVESIRPNPAVDHVNVPLSLTATASVSVDVFDALGRRVIGIPAERHLAGTSSVLLDVGSLASGNYAVCVRIGNQSFTRQLVVVH